MSLMKLLQQAQGGQGLAQIAEKLNMDPAQAETLAQMLAPAIGSAAKKRAEAGQAQDVISGLLGEGNAQFFDNPAKAASPMGRAKGQEFLEQLLGGKAETQELAQEAANRAGVDANTVAQFLPALAGLLQGGMQKNMPDDSLQSMLGQLAASVTSSMSAPDAAAPAARKGGLGGLLGGLLGGKAKAPSGTATPAAAATPDLAGLMRLLDEDGDGSPLDDVLGKLIK